MRGTAMLKKGFDTALNVFNRLRKRFPEATLHIVGKNYEVYLRENHLEEIKNINLKMTRKLFIIGFALSSLLATAQSETEQQQELTPTRSRTTAEALQEEKQYPATIEGQFDELVDKSGNWEKFKLVKKESIYTFKKSLLDSLSGQKTLLREKLDTISAQSSRIKELNLNIQNLQSELDKEKNRNDSIDFLGITIEKGVYSIIVWGIIVVLVIFLVVFIL